MNNISKSILVEVAAVCFFGAAVGYAQIIPLGIDMLETTAGSTQLVIGGTSAISFSLIIRSRTSEM